MVRQTPSRIHLATLYCPKIVRGGKVGPKVSHPRYQFGCLTSGCVDVKMHMVQCPLRSALTHLQLHGSVDRVVKSGEKSYFNIFQRGITCCTLKQGSGPNHTGRLGGGFGS